MKRIASILLAVMLLSLLCACGGTDSNVEYIYFQNDTGEKIDGFYISSTSADTWGDKLNLSSVSAGGNIHINIEKLVEGPGVVYDIGAIDENGLVFEIYEVPVNTGDTIALSADGDTGVVTLTDVQGNTTVYEGYTYLQEE